MNWEDLCKVGTRVKAWASYGRHVRICHDRAGLFAWKTRTPSLLYFFLSKSLVECSFPSIDSFLVHRSSFVTAFDFPSNMYQILPVLLFSALISGLSLQNSPSENPRCPIVFDGRVPPFIEPSAFDRGETPFSGLRPRDIKWSSILNFPTGIPPSMFDKEYSGKPIELNINDLAVLRPAGTGAQTGYRRSELIFVNNTGDDASTRGVKTYHWSVGQGRPLNFSHEYLMVFHERKDGKGYQFKVEIGALVGKERQYNSRHWKVLDHDNKVIFSTPSAQQEWENFAITLDYVQKYGDPCAFLPANSCFNPWLTNTLRVAP
jgi:hypothetical protein